MQENLQFFAIFHEFLWRAIKATNMLQLYTANFLYSLLIHLKLWSSSFRLNQVFPILMIQMLFPQIQQAPGPDQKGKKIPDKQTFSVKL